MMKTDLTKHFLESRGWWNPGK